MFFEKSLSLITASTLLVLTTAIAHANDIQAKTNNVQVSVTEQTIDLHSSSSNKKASFLERLRFWRANNSRVPIPSTSASNRCQTINSSHHSTRTSNSGHGVVQSSSSSSSTVCN